MSAKKSFHFFVSFFSFEIIYIFDETLIINYFVLRMLVNFI